MTTPPTGVELMRQFVPNSPYVGHLGMRIAEISPDRAILELPFRDEVVTIGQTVHGGALASLIDTAAMIAAWSAAETSGALRGTTVGLNVAYLAAANGENVRAEAQVIRRGRSIVYVDVDVLTASGTQVAKGTVIYKIG